MKADLLLLRLGELTLKGKNRLRFENRVLQHVRSLLKPFPQVTVTREFGRMYLELNGASIEVISAGLKKVFGLHSFSPVRRAHLEVENIQEVALSVFHALPEQTETFKVSVRRVNKNFPYDTQQMNPLVGGHILQHTPGLRVNVHAPDVELHVEIRDEQAYVYCDVVKGLGGFPIGTNGRAMLMLSGGIDSPVAGWLAMRKGLKVEAVHFHSYPYTSERAKQKVIQLTEKLSAYTTSIRLHIVPFTDIQLRLKETVQPNLMITLMRRAMFRITEALADQQEAEAIVTGESLGQVASQTLSSMNTIGRVTHLPILRPLITMDKSEIIAIAENIHTLSISLLPYEDCCTLFVPQSPSTNPNVKIVDKIEARILDYNQLIEDAVRNTEMLIIPLKQKDETAELF